ncbi:MAG: adenylyltransferase/cytidyltransferase family protein [Phycisphaerae bacterium]|nr:adenylyltransferase/cytidyltransferase family protein [Phycisphaerae bacterium]
MRARHVPRRSPRLDLVVFANGCFDLLHVGHVRLLQWARRQGDRLVIGLNSDESVQRHKGPGRPIMPRKERCELLLALKAVDAVHVFEEDDATRLIRLVQPDLVVKGPECADMAFPEYEAALAVGARVVVPDWPITQSSSNIIDRIRHGGGISE